MFLFRNHAPPPVLRSFCLILRRTNKNFRKCVDSFSTLPIMRLHTAGVISSVGRASPLHGGGRRFEPVIAHHSHLIAVVPKWAISSVGRASPLHGGGRRFEPVIAHHFGSLAQLVEQLTFNQLVAGSNPARPTNVKKRPKGAFLLSAHLQFVYFPAVNVSINVFTAGVSCFSLYTTYKSAGIRSFSGRNTTPGHCICA